MSEYLRIIKSTSISVSRTACGIYTSISGKLWNESGIYLDTNSNSLNCDSIITINLVIEDGEISLTETACNAYTSPSGRVWTISEIYVDSVLNENCRDVYVIDLTVISLEKSVIASGPVLAAEPSDGQYTWLNCSNGDTVITNAIDQTYLAEVKFDNNTPIPSNRKNFFWLFICIFKSQSCFNT